MQDYRCTIGSNWLPVHTGLLNALECGHLGVQTLQFFDSFGIDPFAFPAAAAGTYIADDAYVTTDGVTVNGMVDGAVADAEVVHTADNGLESFHIPGGIAVQLHVGDVTGVAQGVVGGFQTDLVVDGDGEPDGNVERVGVIFPIGDTGQTAVTLSGVLPIIR